MLENIDAKKQVWGVGYPSPPRSEVMEMVTANTMYIRYIYTVYVYMYNMIQDVYGM